MLNNLKMSAHNIKMHKKHYCSTNMQKTLSIVSYLFWYRRVIIFRLTELLWAQGYGSNTDQDSFFEWILYFKYYIQSLSTYY